MTPSSPALGNLLHVRISIALRIGAKVCKIYACVHGWLRSMNWDTKVSDAKRVQATKSCAAINDVLHQSLDSANIPVVLEPLEISLEDEKLSVGLTLTAWRERRCLIWDTTCMETLTASYIHTTSEFSFHAGETSYVSKNVNRILWKVGLKERITSRANHLYFSSLADLFLSTFFKLNFPSIRPWCI